MMYGGTGIVTKVLNAIPLPRGRVGTGIAAKVLNAIPSCNGGNRLENEVFVADFVPECDFGIVIAANLMYNRYSE
jgi:hypothetical protein